MPSIPRTHPMGPMGQCRLKGSSVHGKSPTMALQPVSTKLTRGTAQAPPPGSSLQSCGRTVGGMSAQSSPAMAMHRHADSVDRALAMTGPAGGSGAEAALVTARRPVDRIGREPLASGVLRGRSGVTIATSG